MRASHGPVPCVDRKEVVPMSECSSVASSLEVGSAAEVMAA
jgi:hypothetical protein